MKHKIIILLFIFISLIFSSCSKDSVDTKNGPADSAEIGSKEKTNSEIQSAPKEIYKLVEEKSVDLDGNKKEDSVKIYLKENETDNKLTLKFNINNKEKTLEIANPLGLDLPLIKEKVIT